MSSTGTVCLLTLAIVSAIWKCGAGLRRVGLDNRIIGGYETTIEEFPFMLALEGGRRQICAGSVLTRDWALTAAHCVYNQPVKWLTFRSGSTVREAGGTLHPVKYYVYHDLYRRDTVDYDIAVVYVRVPFEFKDSVTPIILPKAPVGQGENVVVAGWGYLEQQQLRKPKHLMALEIRTYAWELCQELYPGATERMMCAGDDDIIKPRDICSGDSGGPLIRGQREQIGIVSWGLKCGDGKPSVYTNVSVLIPWIKTSTGLDTGEFFVFPD